jgi:hypothetical protein
MPIDFFVHFTSLVNLYLTGVRFQDGELGAITYRPALTTFRYSEEAERGIMLPETTNDIILSCFQLVHLESFHCQDTRYH